MFIVNTLLQLVLKKKLIIKKASYTTNNVIREKQGPYTLIGSKMLHLFKVLFRRHHLVTRAVPCKDSYSDLLAAMLRRSLVQFHMEYLLDPLKISMFTWKLFMCRS